MTQPTPAQQAEPLEQAKKALRDVVWDGDPTMEQYNALVDAVIAAALRAAVSPQEQDGSSVKQVASEMHDAATSKLMGGFTSEHLRERMIEWSARLRAAVSGEGWQPIASALVAEQDAEIARLRDAAAVFAADAAAPTCQHCGLPLTCASERAVRQGQR